MMMPVMIVSRRTGISLWKGLFWIVICLGRFGDNNSPDPSVRGCWCLVLLRVVNGSFGTHRFVRKCVSV